MNKYLIIPIILLIIGLVVLLFVAKDKNNREKDVSNYLESNSVETIHLSEEDLNAIVESTNKELHSITVTEDVEGTSKYGFQYCRTDQCFEHMLDEEGNVDYDINLEQQGTVFNYTIFINDSVWYIYEDENFSSISKETEYTQEQIKNGDFDMD